MGVTAGAAHAPADCLTPEQVKAVAAFRSVPTTPHGSMIHAHAFPAGAAPWKTVADVYDLTNSILRFYVDSVAHPSASVQTFDYDGGGFATLNRARSIYEAHQIDLRAFKARGGKLLLWHGLADNGVPATSSIDYYNAVAAAMGGREAIDGFFRLFLFPGLGHCTGGPGPGFVDRLEVMEAWVAKGQAPDVIVGQHLTKGVVDRTRPVYPYPIVARYRDSGDPKDAASFAPSRPRE
jgi:feruloyl esterase